MAETDTLKVFISYSRKDSEAFADELVAALEFHGGFAVTIDRHSIVEGEDWKKRLSALIADADTVVFVVSPGAAASPVCQWEVDEAARLSKRILPVLWLAPGDTPVPARLAALHYTRFDEGRSFISGFKALVTSLNTDLDWLRDHTKYLTRAMDWDDGGRKANRILSGKDIAEMKAWAARRPRNAPELTPLHLDFLKASEEAETERFAAERRQIEHMRAAQEEREKALAAEREALAKAAEAQTAREAEQLRRARLQRILLGGAIAAAIGFGGLGIHSYNLRLKEEVATLNALSAQQMAESERNRAKESEGRAIASSQQALAQSRAAEAARKEAEASRNEAKRNLAREARTAAVFRATQAETALKDGDAATAMLLALEALPDAQSKDEFQRTLPAVPGAKLILRTAWSSLSEQVVFSGHTGAVRSAHFSPNGRRVLTASSDGTARLWTLDGKMRAVCYGHVDAVVSAVFSPDGSRILTASDDNTARLWDENGKQIAVLKHAGDVASAVFSRDGSRILTAAHDDTARLWSIDGKELVVFKGHENSVTSAVFSSDETKVLTASWDDTARLWATDDGKLLATLKHDDTVTTALFSPSGDQILTGSHDDTARLWHLAGTQLGEPLGHDSDVNGALFSASGDHILTYSDDNTAKVWTSDGKAVSTLSGHKAGIRDAIFLSLESQENFEVVLTASADTSVRGWTIVNGTNAATLAGHEDAVVDIEFSPDNKLILSASSDGTARLWGVEPDATQMGDQALIAFDHHTDEVFEASFSIVGDSIVTASADDTALVFDATGTSSDAKLLLKHTEDINSAQFSRDGKLIVTASDDDTARIWDRDGHEVAVLEGHEDDVSGAEFSSDDKHILTISDDNTARIWEIAPGTNHPQSKVFRGHDELINAAVLVPGGRHVATASDDDTAGLWDRATGERLAELKHGDDVNDIAVSPDGKRIVTASDDDTARVWEIETASDGNVTVREIGRIAGHIDDVNSVVFAPDGNSVLTASSDNTAALWVAEGPAPKQASPKQETASRDPQDKERARASPDEPGEEKTRSRAEETAAMLAWRRLAEFRGHTGAVLMATFSHNGKLILTASADDTARIWDSGGQALDVLFGHSDDVTIAAFSQDDRRILTVSNDRTVRLWRTDADFQPVIHKAKNALPRCVALKSRPTLHLPATAPEWCEKRHLRPHDAASALLRGMEALTRGDLLAATAELETAVRLGRSESGNTFTLGETHLALAHLYSVKGEPDAVSSSLVEADRLGQDVPRFLMSRARMASEGSNHDEAVAMLDGALQWASRDGEKPEARSLILFERGRIHHVSGRTELAAQDFEAAGHSRFGDVAAFHIARSFELKRDDKPKEELAAAEEALRWASRDGVERPVRADAYARRGAARRDNGQHVKALEDFREAERLGDEEGHALVWSGVMQLAEDTEETQPINALLDSLSHALDLPSTSLASIEATRLREESLRWSYPIAILHARSAQHTANATDCDRLAAHLKDPYRVSPPTMYDKLDAHAVIAACATALSTSPDQPRFLLQRARAHSKAGDEAKNADNTELSRTHYTAMHADLDAAMQHGYPIAYNNKANAYQYGDGVDNDSGKAADLYLESSNRVAHCCFVPVARHMLEVEDKHDKARIRRAVGALLRWSADLGSGESHTLLAELLLDGRLEAPADSDARHAALEHLKIAERLSTAAGKADAASVARAKAATLAKEIPDAVATAEARAASFTAATFTDLPPWLRLPEGMKHVEGE